MNITNVEIQGFVLSNVEIVDMYSGTYTVQNGTYVFENGFFRRDGIFIRTGAFKRK